MKKLRQLEAAKQARKEAKGDHSHLKGAQPLPQPTLPNLSVDDDSSSMKTYTQDSYYYKGDKGFNSEYPPMPAYNNPYLHHQAPSSATLPCDYDDRVNLTADAAPFAAWDPIDRQGSPYGPPYGGNYDAHDVYQGRTGSAPQQQHRRSPPSSMGQPQGGIAYDDVAGYQHTAGMITLDNPYDGYSSPPSRGRNYDVEGGGPHAL